MTSIAYTEEIIFIIAEVLYLKQLNHEINTQI